MKPKTFEEKLAVLVSQGPVTIGFAMTDPATEIANGFVVRCETRGWKSPKAPFKTIEEGLDDVLARLRTILERDASEATEALKKLDGGR